MLRFGILLAPHKVDTHTQLNYHRSPSDLVPTFFYCWKHRTELVQRMIWHSMGSWKRTFLQLDFLAFWSHRLHSLNALKAGHEEKEQEVDSTEVLVLRNGSRTLHAILPCFGVLRKPLNVQQFGHSMIHVAMAQVVPCTVHVLDPCWMQDSFDVWWCLWILLFLVWVWRINATVWQRSDDLECWVRVWAMLEGTGWYSMGRRWEKL